MLNLLRLFYLYFCNTHNTRDFLLIIPSFVFLVYFYAYRLGKDPSMAKRVLRTCVNNIYKQLPNIFTKRKQNFYGGIILLYIYIARINLQIQFQILFYLDYPCKFKHILMLMPYKMFQNLIYISSFWILYTSFVWKLFIQKKGVLQRLGITKEIVELQRDFY